MVDHPFLYEINTWVWLTALARTQGRGVTLDDIPDAEWTTVKGGHACLWEFPAPFNTAAIEFLDRHRG